MFNRIKNTTNKSLATINKIIRIIIIITRINSTKPSFDEGFDEDFLYI